MTLQTKAAGAASFSAAAGGSANVQVVVATANTATNAIPGSVSGATVSVTAEAGASGEAGLVVEFQGYGQVSSKSGDALPPPPPPPPPSYDAAPQMSFSSVGTLSEQEARQALFEFANSRLCLGTNCAKEMVISQIASSSTLEYILETFCEKRTTKVVEVPYAGGPVDGPAYGRPPAPWSIPCSPDSLFLDHEKYLEVPHTATIRPCEVCRRLGYKQCHYCNGRGNTRCSTCHGTGRRETLNGDGTVSYDDCPWCNAGYTSCGPCHGDGRITCGNCNGYAQLKNFVQLTVTFTNHKSNYILKSSDLPDDLISSAPGINIFEQTLPQVFPINDYPIADINLHSLQLIQQHRAGFQNELHRHQRQTLRAVPVTEVHYAWKEYRTRYWVYGTNREVYAPDYPQQCCCTVM